MTKLYRKPDLSSSGPRLGWHVPLFLRHEASAKPTMMFYSHAKKTHFYKTGFALSLVLKVKGLELGHGLYAISTFPIMHLTCPPKFCISIVFDFSWNGCNTQEKWKTKLLQNFGGQIICIMGNVEVANWKNEKRHSHVPVCVPVLLVFIRMLPACYSNLKSQF